MSLCLCLSREDWKINTLGNLNNVWRPTPHRVRFLHFLPGQVGLAPLRPDALPARTQWPILRAMHYRRFGRTNLAMPVISCGGMRYQFKWQDVSPGDIPKENQANLEACIHRALEAGIDHIETARGYGTS